VRRNLERFARHRRLRHPSQPKQHWDFHQPERRLTTRRAGDKAPIRKKGALNFLYGLKNSKTVGSMGLSIAVKLPTW
jgi:hypothetical protein